MEESLTNLAEFYGFSLKEKPELVTVQSRHEINEIWGKDTPEWNVGWINAKENKVFLLAQDKMATESSHEPHTDEQYAALLTHELSHLFFRELARGADKPNWLWEGTAIYTSGQLKFRKPVAQFSNFLDCFDRKDAGDVYQESGWAVELLVDKFGKDKLLSLIKALPENQDRTTFNIMFAQLYGFEPSYGEFNRLLDSR